MTLSINNQFPEIVILNDFVKRLISLPFVIPALHTPGKHPAGIQYSLMAHLHAVYPTNNRAAMPSGHRPPPV
jgi:hypothetical protein